MSENISNRLTEIGILLRPILCQLSPGAGIGLLVYLLQLIIFLMPSIVHAFNSGPKLFLGVFFLYWITIHLMGVFLGIIHMVSEHRHTNASEYAKRITAGYAPNLHFSVIIVLSICTSWIFAFHSIMAPLFSNPREQRDDNIRQ